VAWAVWTSKKSELPSAENDEKAAERWPFYLNNSFTIF
jgi:hypothetical protein